MRSTPKKSLLFRFPTISFLDALFGLVFVVSLSFVSIGATGLSIQGIAFERHIALLGGSLALIALWLIRGVVTGKIELPRTPLDMPIVLVLGVLVLSALVSGDVWHSVWGFWGDPSRGVLAYLSYFVFYFATFHLVRIGKVGVIIFGLGVTTISVSAWVLWWNIAPNTFFDVEQYREVFFDGVSSAYALLFLLPILLGWAQSRVVARAGESVKYSPWITGRILLFLVVFVAFSLSVSVISWVWAVAVFSGWLLLALLLAILRHPKTAWFPLSLAFVAVGAYFGGSIFVYNDERPSSLITANDQWEIVQGALGENMFVGVGPSLYGQVFARYRPLELNQTDLVLARPYEAPGLLFEVGATWGTLGFVALMFLFLFAFGVALFGGFDGKMGRIHEWMGALVSMLALGGYVLVSEASGLLLLLWFVLVALVLGLAREGGSTMSTRTLSTRPSSEYMLSAAFAVFVVAGALGYSAYMLARISVADAVGAMARNSTSHEVAIAYYERALALYPQEGRYASFVARRYLGVLEEGEIDVNNASDLERVEDDMNTASEYATRGMNRMPGDVTAVEMAAQVYEKLSVYEAEFSEVASQTYGKATELEPHNPRLYSKQGEMIIRQAIDTQDPQKKREILKQAKQSLETALSKKDEFPQAWYLLALTQEGLEEVDGAINSALRATAFAPNDAGALRLLARLYDTRANEGDFEKAKNLYEEAAKINEDDVASYYALAVMHKREGDLASALRYYSLALGRLSPENEEERARIERERDDVLQSISGEDTEDTGGDTEDISASRDIEDIEDTEGDIGGDTEDTEDTEEK